MAELSIGSTIWVFNINRRVYEDGKSGPVWRHHWEPATVTGETSRSWVIDDGNPRYGGFKLSKTEVSAGTYNKMTLALSQEDIDRAEWINTHRYKVSAIVSVLKDYDLLKKIAGLVGYKERAD